MNDYIPFMDLHPELMLVPASSVNIGVRDFQRRFDYVQDLNRKDAKGGKETFHLLVKDGKFGVLLYTAGFFRTMACVALPAVYDQVIFLYKKGKAFGAIVQHQGKFGLNFWEYGAFLNKKYSVPAVYDSLELLENGRIMGVKDGNITYFDPTGHVLK